MGQHPEALLDIQLKNVLDPVKLTNGCLHGITTHYTASHYSITWELPSTVQLS
jgi:hypothetical protein